MKIAMVVPGGLHPSGDREVVPSWLALFDKLSERHEIHAFVLKHLPEAQDYRLLGFTVHDLGRPSAALGLTRWAQARSLVEAIRKSGKFDLIHGFLADPAGQLAARTGQRLKIPSVVTCDSGEFVSLPAIAYGSQRTARGRRAVSDACAHATRVHVCTKFMAGLSGRRDDQTVVIPLTSITADTAMPTPAAARPDDTVPFRLVQVASLSRVKNQRLLIDALAIVRHTINAHLHLVGEDTLGGELQHHADNSGLGPYVTFHGFLPQPQVREVLSSADLYVQSSLHEAAGVSVLEAAAAGVPVVGTSAGYVADWSPHKAAAIGEATPESLANAILALHADPDRRRSMAVAARDFAITHDAAWSAARFDDLYRSLKP